MAELKYVDLFSGCGGLSLGLERAGLELIVAVEKSEMPAQTFYHNFIDSSLSDADWKEYLELDISEQLSHKVIPRTVAEVLGDAKVMQRIIKEGVDIVCGGPPCQGFSTAGRRDHSDPRNQLAWEFLDFVSKTNPKMVIIENVLGMNRAFPGVSQTPFQMYAAALANVGNGYTVQKVIVNAKHYGAPQSRPRVMIIGVRSDIVLSKNITSNDEIWKSDFTDSGIDIPTLAPVPTVTLEELSTIGDAISDLQANNALTVTTRKNSERFLDFVQNKNNWQFHSQSTTTQNLKNRDLPNHSALTIERFRLKQALYHQGLHKDIIYKYSCGNDVSSYLTGAVFPLVSPDGILVIHDSKQLFELLDRVKSKKRTQQVLDPNLPSKTVLTIAENYIHPTEPRMFVVREMARFQAFPDSFVFRGRISTGGAMRKYTVPQYSQVGNAVSPALSFAVGTMIVDTLQR